MGNTTGTIKLPSSDNHDVIEANKRLKKFLTENLDLLINKSPREISQFIYDQTGQPILDKECLERLCSSIKQIIEESFEISSNIFYFDDNDRNLYIYPYFRDFKIQKIKIPFADCMGNPLSGNPREIELTTSYIAVSKIIDIYNYICEVSNNSSLFANTLHDCLDKVLTEQETKREQFKVSRGELETQLGDWDYNHEDKPKIGGRRNKSKTSKYKKRKTNKSKKSRKHIRSRSRRYRKSRK